MDNMIVPSTPTVLRERHHPDHQAGRAHRLSRRHRVHSCSSACRPCWWRWCAWRRPMACSGPFFRRSAARPITVMDRPPRHRPDHAPLNLPVEIPLWQAMFGSFVPSSVIKQFFGGIGQNFATPPFTARPASSCWCLAAPFTTGRPPPSHNAPADAVTAAPPGHHRQARELTTLGPDCSWRPGRSRARPAAALLLGGIYLIYRRRDLLAHPLWPSSHRAGVHRPAGPAAPVFRVMAGGCSWRYLHGHRLYTTSPHPRRQLIFRSGLRPDHLLIRDGAISRRACPSSILPA